MAIKSLSNTGIATGQTVQAAQVSQSINAFTATDDYRIKVSGSFVVTGSLITHGPASTSNFVRFPNVASKIATGSIGAVLIDPAGNLYSGSISSGTKGQKGETGTKGAAGTKGASGSKGQKGEVGPKGSEGPQGNQGPKGAQGSGGTKGPAGDKGAKGEDGASGPKGSAGPAGPQGPAGPKGANGPKGSTGAKGSTGSGGPKGSIGPKGSEGPAGPAGPKGQKGEDSSVAGPKGQKGADGATGPKGQKGAEGPQGNVGPKGSNGPTGTKGSVGPSGPKGQKGQDGGAGPKGSVGPQGPAGPKGQKGDDSSVAGPKGQKGQDGPAGPKGSAGPNGPKGQKGEIGSKGSEGPAGPKGATGTSAGTNFNGQVTYLADSSGADYEIYLQSTGNLYSGLSWSRSTTTITVTSTAHGLSTGDFVILRNMSLDYARVSITSTGANTFTATVTDSGDTSGTAGAYVPVLGISSVTNNSGDVTAVTVDAPSAGNVQLNSVRLFANNQETSPCTYTVPASLSNGAGGFNDKQDINQALLIVNGFDGTGNSTSISSATAQYNLGSNFNQIRVNSIDNFSPIMTKLVF